jgi:hypothetical protein
MSHRLLNSYEEVTYERVREVAGRNGAHVFSKVRIADAIPLNNSGVSDADFSFALKAHLDFLVTDANYSTLFAVEFDGPTHRTDTQQQRDRQKDTLMERFTLPLLRINANYLNRKYRDLDLLTYFVEVWFLRDAFFKAQESGHVPVDEPFDPASVLSDGRNNRSWPFWLSIETQAKIQDLSKAGQVASHCPNYWIGLDDHTKYRCLMWILLPGGGCCFVETGMRTQSFPVSESDTLMQVATFDLFDQLQDVLHGERAPRQHAELEETIHYYTTHFSMRRAGGSASPNELSPS